jgi:hypothetical protein
VTDDNDNIIKLAFSAEVDSKLDEDYMVDMMEKVQEYDEPPIMIFHESNAIWVPPKMRMAHTFVAGILQKWIHIILHGSN